MRDLFTRHPASVGESYLEHLGMAGGFGFRMVIAGIACILHGLLPFLFVKTGSDCVTKLHERMVTKRAQNAAPSGGPTMPSNAHKA